MRQELLAEDMRLKEVCLVWTEDTWTQTGRVDRREQETWRSEWQHEYPERRWGTAEQVELLDWGGGTEGRSEVWGQLHEVTSHQQLLFLWRRMWNHLLRGRKGGWWAVWRVPQGYGRPPWVEEKAGEGNTAVRSPWWGRDYDYDKNAGWAPAVFLSQGSEAWS